MPDKELRQSIFSPQMGAEAATDHVKEMKETSAIAVPLYLDGLDKAPKERRFTPLRGGWLLTMLACPGNGKTSMAVWHAVQRANWLAKNHLDNRVALFVSAEVDIETVLVQAVSSQTGVPYADILSGDVEPEDEKKFGDFMAIKVPKIPLWLAGHSSQRRTKKRLSVSDAFVDNVMTEIEGWGGPDTYQIDITYLDYLQLFALDNRQQLSRQSSKAEMVSQTVHNFREIGLNHHSVMWLNSQAKREVEQRNGDDKMPGVADGFYSSDIEHDSTVVAAGWRPGKYYNVGKIMRLGTDNIPVVDNMFMFTVWKHRYGPSNLGAKLYYNAAIAQFGSLKE